MTVRYPPMPARTGVSLLAVLIKRKKRGGRLYTTTRPITNEPRRHDERQLPLHRIAGRCSIASVYARHFAHSGCPFLASQAVELELVQSKVSGFSNEAREASPEPRAAVPSKRNSKPAAISPEPSVLPSNRNIESKAILLDVPLFSLASRPFACMLAPVWRALCATRWALQRPLNAPLLPAPAMCGSVPYLSKVPYFTIGEALFLAPIALVMVMAVNSSLRNMDVEGSGEVATIPLVVVFLTANKSNSLITFALGVPYERMISWHALWSLAAVAAAGLHLYCAFYLGESDDRRLEEVDDGIIVETEDNEPAIAGGRRLVSRDLSGSVDSIYGLNGPNPDLIKFSLDGNTNFTGTVSLVAMAVLVLASVLSIFRRFGFELWYIVHIGGALLAGWYAFIHGADELGAVLVWWAVDMGARYVLMAGVLYPHKASLRKLPGDIVEISFPKPATFEYEAGQYAKISIPRIGFGQFHPITISSSPRDPVVTMHVKGLGRWSRRLGKLAERQEEVAFLMEGPYGKLMIELENRKRYKMVLMVSGGIGVTPMVSIANDLLYEHQSERREVKKIKFVWALRSVELMRAMADRNAGITGGANVLDPKSASEVVDLSVYLTKCTGAVDEEINDIDAGVTKSGRPDMDEIFLEMKRAAREAGEAHIAVCVCGPSKMVDACRQASRRFSDGVFTRDGVKFDFHEEKFEF